MKKKTKSGNEPANRLTVAIAFLATLHGIIHLLAVCYMVHSPYWAAFGDPTHGTLGLSVIDQISLIGGISVAWGAVHLFIAFEETKRIAPRLAAVVLLLATMGTLQYHQHLKTGIEADRSRLANEVVKWQHRIDSHEIKGVINRQMRYRDITEMKAILD